MYSVIKIKVNEANFMKFLKKKINMICQNVTNKNYWSFDLKTYFEKICGNKICIWKYVK